MTVDGNKVILNTSNADYLETSTPIILRTSVTENPSAFVEQSFNLIVCSGELSTNTELQLPVID